MNTKSSKFTDGLPPLAPAPGTFRMFHLFVNGSSAATCLEVWPALPEGHYHLDLIDCSTDEGSVVWLTRRPIPAAELTDRVLALVTERFPYAFHTVWIPSEWPDAEGPSAAHPRRTEASS